MTAVVEKGLEVRDTDDGTHQGCHTQPPKFLRVFSFELRIPASLRFPSLPKSPPLESALRFIQEASEQRQNTFQAPGRFKGLAQQD